MSLLSKYEHAIAVVDTSAMMRCINILSELQDVFYRVVVPAVCAEELSHLKDRGRREGLGIRAWQVSARLEKHPEMLYAHVRGGGKNDLDIINVARKLSAELDREAYIITDDIDFSCQYPRYTLKVDDVFTEIVYARNAFAGDSKATEEFSRLFLSSWDDYQLSSNININAVLRSGQTVLINAIRSRDLNKYSKIQFLIDSGVNLDQTDSDKYFLTPLSHCVQIKDLRAFKMLLNAKADFNKGSINESKNTSIRCRNEGNTPLMIASWHGLLDFVKLLCCQTGICLNQQDANGYTALIKAAIRKNKPVYDYLRNLHGVDKYIRDRHNHTADWHMRNND